MRGAGRSNLPLQLLVAPGAQVGEESASLGAVWGLQASVGQLLQFRLQVRCFPQSLCMHVCVQS